FNADSTTNGIYFDWRVQTSEQSYEGFRYLFTGPAPVPQAPPPTSPPATTPTTAPPATSPPATSPKPVTPKPVTPKPVTAKPVVTKPPPEPELPARQPTPRLTWMLNLLRHLDSITVAP
ncbi:MAG: hypothetical protein ACRDZ3_01305, partial [Acidimicrobiia bacterium]